MYLVLAIASHPCSATKFAEGCLQKHIRRQQPQKRHLAFTGLF